MLVKVLSFGSNWWARFGNVSDHRFTRHAAYYNSTGIRCGLKIRRHWITSGLIRFNVMDGFDSNCPDRAVGCTFICSDLTEASGGNRLLFRTKAPTDSIPDCYLVVISSKIHGGIDFSSCVWKSVLSRTIAASQLRSEQEAMLLMKSGDWVQTSRGFWQLIGSFATHQPAGLVRIGESVSA